MIKYEDECINCPPEIGCVKEICPYYRVPHLFCDECGNEVEELYDYGNEICIDCLFKHIPKIKIE